LSLTLASAILKQQGLLMEVIEWLHQLDSIAPNVRMVFRETNSQGSFMANFLSSHYEPFTLGLQSHLDKIDPYNKKVIEKLKELFLSIKNDAQFQVMATGGDRDDTNRLRDRIAFVEKKVEEIF
jgi:hypothetical protein